MTDEEWHKEWQRLHAIALQAGFVAGSAGLHRYQELYAKMKRFHMFHPDWEAGCWAWEQALREAGVLKTAVDIGDMEGEYEEAMRGIEIMEGLG